MSRTVYRGMVEDEGAPLVARNAKALGVRIEGDFVDVHVDADGSVRPGEGMSVAPDDPYSLPDHRRSETFGGSAKYPTWSLELDRLPDELEFEQDSLIHGLIGPAQTVALTIYEGHLGSTRPDWVRE